MTQGIHQLTANMVNQLNRVDVISNNLANANTVGFKEDNLSEGSFNRYLRNKELKDEVTIKEAVIMDTIPKIDGAYKNESHGSLQKTENPLDFALKDDKTFFKVRNTQGNIEYTRDGSFKVQNGELVNQNNYLVLDSNDEPININTADFTSRIAVVSSEFTNLEKLGNNNYKAVNEDEITTLAVNDGVVLQGALEQSNVNTIKTMVGLIEAQRQFEQSQKAITGIDTINSKVIDTIGSDK